MKTDMEGLFSEAIQAREIYITTESNEVSKAKNLCRHARSEATDKEKRLLQLLKGRLSRAVRQVGWRWTRCNVSILSAYAYVQIEIQPAKSTLYRGIEIGYSAACYNYADVDRRIHAMLAMAEAYNIHIDEEVQ